VLSFNFAGKDSYIDFGILISKRPTIPSPKRRVTYIDIPGKHSSLRYDEETYEDIILGIECTIKDGENIPLKIDEIKAWLFGTGESNLIFSFQNDKYYKAQVVNAIDFEQIYKYTSKFIIIFNCRPFKYAVQNDLITITQTESIIYNEGSIESEPIITVFGTGDITINVNEQSVELEDVDSKIILNTVIQDAYDENINSQNYKMSGEFIRFELGTNLISWTGNVSKLEILPNWRWL
jgi:predicted phage tail component-like protein